MTDTTGPNEHTFVHENLAAYLAGGLEATERVAFEAHIHSCPECFDAFTEARDADLGLKRTLGVLAPLEIAGGAGKFEDQVVSKFRERSMNSWKHPAIRRVMYATAACAALAATGAFANFAIHQGGRFSNPLSDRLVAQADKEAPGFANPLYRLKSVIAFDRAREMTGAAPARTPMVATARKGGRVSDDSLEDAVDEVGGQVRGRTSQVLLAEGRQLYDAQKYRESAEVFKQAAAANPTDGTAQIMQRIAQAKTEDRNYEQTLHRTGQDDLLKSETASRRPPTGAPATHEPMLANAAKEEGGEYARAFGEKAQAGEKQAQQGGQQGQPGAWDYQLKGLSGPVTTAQPGGDDRRMMGRTDSGAGAAGPGIGSGYQAYNDLTVANGQYYAQTDQVFWKDAVAVSGDVSRKGEFSKAGSGTMTVGAGAVTLNGGTLTGQSSSYTGGTTINNGTLATSTPVGRESLAADPNLAYRYSFNDGTKGDVGKDKAAFDGKLQDRYSNDEVETLKLQPGRTKTEEDKLQAQARPGLVLGPAPAESPATFSGNVRGLEGTLAFDRSNAIKLDTPASGKPSAAPGGTPSTDVRFADGHDTLDNSRPPAVGDLPYLGQMFKRVEGTLPTLTTNDFAKDKVAVGERGDKWNMPDAKVVYEVRDMLAAATPEPPKGGTPNTETPKGTTPNAGTRPAAPPNANVETVAALKIIRNGTISFEVRNFDDSYVTVQNVAAEERGFVSSTSSEKLANGHVRGTIVVRVPPERLDRFLMKIRALGDLKAQQIGAADVTKQYTDIESELRGLRTMETRMLDLIKSGKGEVKDLVAAEQKLGEYRVQIEKLEGEIRYYNNLVSLATITITAYEKDIASPTAASEQEMVNVNLETEEVESKYQAARKVLDDAKGRIIESQLKNTDAEHTAAHIVAEVPPDKADFVAAQLKQLGKVASFNRDRKQTTTGGTGTPNVQVEKKDTRFTIDLFNLANLAPRETTVMRIAVRDVETAYKAILTQVKHTAEAPLIKAGAAAPVDGAAKDGTGTLTLTGAAAAAAPAPEAPAAKLTGRILSSNLTGQIPEQMAADIRAEIRAETSDSILAALRNSGEVLASSLATNPDNANTTGAKRGIQVTLVNIAAIGAKESDTVNVAVRDVDAAYKAALALIRTNARIDAATPGANLLPPTNGRVLSSNLNGTQPTQMTADIRAEVRSDLADTILSSLKGQGEVLNASVTESPEQINFTRVKRGLVVRFINVAAVAPREVRQMRGIAASVQGAYEKLLGSLQELAAAGDVRITGSGLRDSDPRQVAANFSFEVRREKLAAVEDAFKKAQVEFPARTITRSTDTTNTLDTKVLFQIDEIRSAESMDPRRIITLSEEVENVDKSVSELRKALAALPRDANNRASYKEVDFTVSRDQYGRVTAHWTLDLAVAQTQDVRNAINDLGGIEKNNQEVRNTQVPETTLAKERIDLTLFNKPTVAPIVESGKGFGQSVRAALTAAAGALLYSVYLVLTGLLFVAPFLLIVWPVWAIIRRKKAPAKSA